MKTNKNQSFSTKQDKSDIMNNRTIGFRTKKKKSNIFQKIKIKIDITSTHSSI
jgi:hypothetical protein